jgi:hypothetical protein
MMNVLDMLKYRLASPGAGAPSGMPSPQDMAALRQRQQAWGQQQLADLPPAVRDSIMNNPSYGEGMPVGVQRYERPMFEPSLPLQSPYRRDFQLHNERGFDREFRREGVWPVPEGLVATPLPPGQSPFASPLNQLMQYGQGGRPPWALY